MKSFYQSETVSYVSNPAKGKPYGRRNVVTIKNGRGTKTSMKLGANGKILRRKTMKLSRSEAKNVLGGKFMHGFWKNCSAGDC